MLSPQRPFRSHNVAPKDVQHPVHFQRLGEVIAPRDNLRDDVRIACEPEYATRRYSKEEIGFELSKGLVAEIPCPIGVEKPGGKVSEEDSAPP